MVLVLAQNNSKYCHRQYQGKQLTQTNLIYVKKKKKGNKNKSLTEKNSH